MRSAQIRAPRTIVFKKKSSMEPCRGRTVGARVPSVFLQPADIIRFLLTTSHLGAVLLGLVHFAFSLEIIQNAC
jgi:hypothetical protein